AGAGSGGRVLRYRVHARRPAARQEGPLRGAAGRSGRAGHAGRVVGGGRASGQLRLCREARRGGLPLSATRLPFSGAVPGRGGGSRRSRGGRRSMSIGPKRLVLINSGNYDYADLDLSRSGHLVGRNNLGKTSLIATLQFLYGATEREWQFSEPNDKSRAFYFASAKSFVIFVCETPQGLKTTVIRGLGPLHGHKYERSVYDGDYRTEDYFDDDNAIREPEAIKRLLSDREFRVVKPEEYRQVLLGTASGGLPNLGLVPVRNTEHYRRFYLVFRSLINLGHISNNDFKDVLIDSVRGEGITDRIAFLEKWGRTYQKLQAETRGVRVFERSLQVVEEVLAKARERAELRGQIPVLFNEADQHYRERLRAIQDQIEAHSRRRAELDEQHQQLRQRWEEQNAALQATVREAGGIEAMIRALQQRRAEFADFD